MPVFTSQRAAFVHRIASRGSLGAEDVRALGGLVERLDGFSARTDIVHDGARMRHVHLLIDGYAARYKLRAGGERQIMHFHLPGEVLDFHASMLGRADHSIATLSRCRVARVPQAALSAVFEAHPAIGRAFWQETLVDGAIARAWLMNIGRRDSFARVSHLFCELKVRMQAIGRCPGLSFEFPATQVELGDAMGMTAVHMNRTLQALRAARLVSVQDHCITIHDWDRLAEVAEFDPAFLYLEPPPGDDTASPRKLAT